MIMLHDNKFIIFFFFRIIPESVMRLILDFLADVNRKQKERDAMNLKVDLIKT